MDSAVEHGGGAFQHFHALKHEGVDLEAAEAIAVERQAIHEDAGLGGVEAANIKPVGIAVIAEGLRGDARRVAQHLVDLVGDAAILHFLPANDGDRLRHLGDRRVSFRTGCRLGGDIALDRGGAVLFAVLLPALDDQWLQHRRALLRHNLRARKDRRDGHAHHQPPHRYVFAQSLHVRHQSQLRALSARPSGQPLK